MKNRMPLTIPKCYLPIKDQAFFVMVNERRARRRIDEGSPQGVVKVEDDKLRLRAGAQ